MLLLVTISSYSLLEIFDASSTFLLIFSIKGNPSLIEMPLTPSLIITPVHGLIIGTRPAFIAVATEVQQPSADA